MKAIAFQPITQTRWYTDGLMIYLLLMMVLIMLNNIPQLGNKYLDLPTGHLMMNWQGKASIGLFELVILLLEFSNTKRWAWVFTGVLFSVSLCHWDFVSMVELSHLSVMLEDGTEVQQLNPWLLAQSIVPAVAITLITTVPVPIVGGKLVARLRILDSRAFKRRWRTSIERWMKRIQQAQEIAANAIELQRELDQALRALEETQRQVEADQRAKKETQRAYEEAQRRREEQANVLNEVLLLLNEWTTCGHCGHQESTPNSVRSHQSKCIHKNGDSAPKQREIPSSLRMFIEQLPKVDEAGKEVQS